MRFRKLLIAFGVIAMAVCASAEQIPSAGESGIEGAITISPANPGPIRADAPGSVPLANATFVVEKNNGEVTSFITDDQGRFRVSLPPGHYKISLKGRKSSIGRFGPFEADVVPGKMTKVQWECDSGIR
jgi:Prealbumin-like fold domain